MTSFFITIMIRATLTEPPVDPAHPPTNIIKNSSTRLNVGQTSKSAVAKPVVVTIVVDWNTPKRRALSTPLPLCSIRSPASSSVVPPSTTT